MQKLVIRSILVAADLSEGSEAVLQSAYALSQRTGAALHVVHALELPTRDYPGVGTALDLQAQIHDGRRELRSTLKRSLPQDAAIASQKIEVGAAAQAIVDRAVEVEADVIVMGPHRPRAFRGPILGNTADRVLRTASVPILILPEALRLPLRRVVAPVDLADPARGALDQALLWAGALGRQDAANALPGVEVVVMHVIPRIYAAYDLPFDRAVIGPQLHEEIQLAQKRIGNGSDVEVHEEAVWGNAPAEEIVKYAQSPPADLLVLGTHGYGALGRALIGSIASRVARMAPCPMLLVPRPLWEIEEAAVNQAEWVSA